MICLLTNWTAHVAHNFNFLIETEVLLEVRGSHIDCISGNIIQTVQDSVI